MAIVEAVPNFSEGRRPEVVAALVEAIQAPGVWLLDVSSDPDHNRTVITVAGEPDAVLEGLFRAVATAAQRINLFEHRGEHPRIGAADVVPIVPIEGITLEECVTLAHRLGRRIGEELGLPVYLYAAAATRPERRRLPDIRRGEFEGLLETIHLPERAPDYGPAKVGPAGATVVGARPFLIAYNIYLRSSDVEIARKIARQIRESSGGLPAVQAKGFLVEGQAQVSMNLLDTDLTPLHVVYARVAALAAEEGVEVASSELIGLIPQKVLLQAAAHFLKLEPAAIERTIEAAMRRARGSESF
ncbi:MULTISPECIES: glutamate formimidoyltransferase [Caldilinea]|jgi:glutamate formiminotransferase|uniref:glutamate formimidoyltransferase n=1 Tax=Caldilinea aerophila (strain DSM 14535 / JCM 11387 / NBRC 104270 / STL-6-O1) TaxID=926550 RepID=I0I7E9_CALAS|nr:MULTISPECIES: glutamate formimidoyltransferase [Caldilinea]MBO9394064.1 glutamate formimidoyltransferase [Caldilinea sp.]BAM01187.1 putative glutamate formiminotransferase [Caldilinea aerophila DSM 14535 = NBRC 104270]GIV72528.1 MAG: glutamate formiminotransferase [Caldilinea sp.]